MIKLCGEANKSLLFPEMCSGGSAVKKLGVDFEDPTKWTRGKQATDVMGEQKELLQVVSCRPRTLYRRERASVPVVQEAG